jgi:large subunit ribosomal protein L1
VNRETLYPLEEAIGLVKSLKPAKFDETIELSVQLGIDAKQTDQQVRTSLSLPHGIGKKVRVVVFSEGENATRAREAGADEVGSDELITKVEGGWMDFDVALATPDMMRKVAKLGRHLGPRGLMPTPKNATVRQDIAEAVKEFQAGKVELRADAGGNIHAPVGKRSFSTEAINANVREVLEHLLRHKPIGVKGRYFKTVVLSATMGPGVKIRV